MKKGTAGLSLISLLALVALSFRATAQQSVDFPARTTPKQLVLNGSCSRNNSNLQQAAFHLPGVPANTAILQSSTQGNLGFHSYSAFWQVGGGYSSTLFLRNKDENNSVAANVVVLVHDGTRIQKSQLVVAANSVGQLALADLIKQDNPNIQWGSVILEFREPSRTFGSVIVENYKQGIIFDVPIQGAYRYDTDNALYVP